MNKVVPPGLDPIAILGTTASGKSALAMELARRRGDVELVSVDSMQVYRGMDLGTAKPTAAEQAEVRHHVIDLVDPTETFDLSMFQAAVTDALADIASRNRRAVLVGGTGLYLRSVVDGFDIPGQFPAVAAELEADPDTTVLHDRLTELDPVAAARMEPTNRRRVVRALEVTLGSGRPFSSYGPGVGDHPPTPVALFGLWLARPVIAARIEARYQQQMVDGFLAEVQALRARGELSHTAGHALGYREMLAYLDAVDAGRPTPTLAVALAGAVVRTRQFSRRQRVWFRRDPRISWVGADTDPMVAFGALEAEAANRWGPAAGAARLTGP